MAGTWSKANRPKRPDMGAMATYVSEHGVIPIAGTTRYTHRGVTDGPAPPPTDEMRTEDGMVRIGFGYPAWVASRVA